MCASVGTGGDRELVGLTCYDGDNDRDGVRPHVLRLRFGVRFKPTRPNSGNVGVGRSS